MTTQGCCAHQNTQEIESQVEDQKGNLCDRKVSKAEGQNSKAWFIVAIVVGSLIVIGAGGFGTAGLLQTHGVVSMPQWLVSAIGTVGSTPHAWGLWLTGVGGVVVGGGLIILGSVKIHHIRKLEEKEEIQKDLLAEKNLSAYRKL